MATQVYLRQVLDGARSQIDPGVQLPQRGSGHENIARQHGASEVYPTMVPTQVFWIEGSRGGAPTRIMLRRGGWKVVDRLLHAGGVKARTYKNEYRHKEGLDPCRGGAALLVTI